MKQKLKPETWVGIFLIAGILMIIGVILGFGNIKTSKEQTYPINIIFKDAAGLIKDSQIRLGGVTVGKVTKAPELLPSGNEVMLEASIQSDVKIQQGSVFRVDMQNILGDKYIDIVPPAQPTHEYILPHATIIGQPESDFSKIKNNAVGATEEILKILKQIEKNSDNIDDAILNIGEAAKGLAQTTRLINPGDLVFVVNKDGIYEGAIYPEDFLAVRRQMEERKGAVPADAGSLVRTGAPVLDAGTYLTDALKLFEQTHLPAFPVVWKNTGRLDGVLYRNALFQVITEMMKRE